MGNDNKSRLVTCDWLAQHLDDPSVRLIEVTSSEDDTKYRQGHIPGAIWWNWKEALWHESDREFPTAENMAARLETVGIAPDTTIVIYGIPVQYGTYAFWVLSMAGHQDVRLLDGGKNRWIAEGRPLDTATHEYDSVAYQPCTADISSRVGRDDVLANIGQATRTLLDVRSPEEYSGERVSPPPNFDHGAERKGRIPGAVHLYYRELLNEDDTFKTVDEMLGSLAQAGITSNLSDEIVTYCRLSHRATLAWFAMRYLLGYDDIKIYDGSWTEWGSIVGFPIEKS